MLSLALFFVLVFFFSPFIIVITSLAAERAGQYVLLVLLFIYFAHIDFCPYSLSLDVGVGCGL